MWMPQLMTKTTTIMIPVMVVSQGLLVLQVDDAQGRDSKPHFVIYLAKTSVDYSFKKGSCSLPIKFMS